MALRSPAELARPCPPTSSTRTLPTALASDRANVTDFGLPYDACWRGEQQAEIAAFAAALLSAPRSTADGMGRGTMTFRVLLLAGALLVTACDKTVATPPGTLLDMPSFTQLSVSEWSIGPLTAPATKEEKTYRYTTDLGPDLRFKITFEHGPSQLVDAKPRSAPPPPVEAPRSIRIDLVENKGWAVTAKCDGDLKVPLDVNPDGTAAYPKMVWTTCDVVMKRKNGNLTVGPHITVRGDGKLELIAFMDDHVEDVSASR